MQPYFLLADLNRDNYKDLVVMYAYEPEAAESQGAAGQDTNGQAQSGQAQSGREPDHPAGRACERKPGGNCGLESGGRNLPISSGV